jgi:hypothetical protein
LTWSDSTGPTSLSINFTNQKRSCGSAGGSMRQREHACVEGVERLLRQRGFGRHASSGK